MLGELETRSLLSVMNIGAGMVEAEARWNRWRRYSNAIDYAKKAIEAVSALAAEDGSEADVASLAIALEKLTAVHTRHQDRIRPPPVLDCEGRVAYQLPEQMPHDRGHGPADVDVSSLKCLAAAQAAGTWFEMNREAVEVRLTPTLLYVAAIALGVEEPCVANSSLQGEIDSNTKRWGKRLKLAAEPSSRSSLKALVGKAWDHRSSNERKAITAAIRQLLADGMKLAAIERTRSLGVPE